MGDPGKSLHERNRAFLVAYGVAQSLIVWACWGSVPLWTSKVELIRLILAPQGLVALAVPLVLTVLIGLVPSALTEVLVFWRLRDRLPGHRVFSELLRRDSRVDARRLIERIGPVPTVPLEQNHTWYRIYLSHEAEPAVLESQSRYLLLRDMAVATAVMAICVPLLFTFFHVGLGVIGGLSACLLLEYLAMAVAAKNYAVRFVLTVLARESAAT